MEQSNNTLNSKSTQDNRNQSIERDVVVACGCGFGGKPSREGTGTTCPLGRPWLCLRQLCLPFEEPLDRRRRATAAGGTPSL